MESENSKQKVEDNVVMMQGRGKDKTIGQEVQNVGKEETRAAPEPQQNATSYAENTPIWFTLIASNEQDTNAPLQQIPSRYLRVKNVKLEVLYIKKYIAKKLSLESEHEVEIYLRNLPLDSSMMLQDLLNHWIATAPAPREVTARVGCSAAKYVMVLTYGRKSQREA